MEIERDCIDALLMELYSELVKARPNEANRGATREIIGVVLRLSKPKARLSRSENRGRTFSALGELLWYLSGSDRLEFIEPYVPLYKDDAVDGVLPGAYGPRIFAMRQKINQLKNVIDTLKENPRTRRAVIQLFNAEDIETRLTEIPCTTTLQFFVRDEKLLLSVTMRSNDAYWGLPHDVFCFTMIQEMVARCLDVGLGEYYHYVGSMHVYERFVEKIVEYMAEGYQKCVEMPDMPLGDPFPLVPQILAAEGMIRRGETISAESFFSDQYWADVVRLLQVFWAKDNDQLDILAGELHSPMFRAYLDGRRKRES
jgi:thymidylate synthase